MSNTKLRGRAKCPFAILSLARPTDKSPSSSSVGQLSKSRSGPERGRGPNHHQSTISPPGGRGNDGEEAGMSVFGGDSWARDAQQRKRRLDDLLLPTTASSSPSTPDSFRKLPNGKLACLVCPRHPPHALSKPAPHPPSPPLPDSPG